MPTPEVHAALGASSAYAWLKCPQYVKVQQLFPDQTSEYAEAGRLAHAMGEYKLRSYFMEPVGKRSYNARLKKFKEDPAYDPGMDEATDLYLETAKAEALTFAAAPFVALEVRVDYSDYAPNGFGTADCILIGGKRLVVIDYKNGAGVPVEAEDNPQLKLYALGAMQTFGMIYGDTLTEVRLVIVQPHAGGVKAWDTDRAALEQWGRETVAPAAKLALEGTAPGQPGAWCRFCRGKSQCTARAAQMLETGRRYAQAPAAGAGQAPAGYEGMLLTDAEVGAALAEGAGLVAWYKDLQDYALRACLDGKTIPGFKAVEGRGSRAWDDTDKALATLAERGVAEALLWERRPVTAPALEKALGKRGFANVAEDLVVKQPGKPTLAPETDKRPPYNAAQAAFQPEAAHG